MRLKILDPGWKTKFEGLGWDPARFPEISGQVTHKYPQELALGIVPAGDEAGELIEARWWTPRSEETAAGFTTGNHFHSSLGQPARWIPPEARIPGGVVIASGRIWAAGAGAAHQIGFDELRVCWGSSLKREAAGVEYERAWGKTDYTFRNDLFWFALCGRASGLGFLVAYLDQRGEQVLHELWSALYKFAHS